MSNYLAWDRINEPNLTNDQVSAKYNAGYVYTREVLGAMYQTRSLRIKLNEFALNSENRRILNKVSGLQLNYRPLPLLPYDWKIHKLGKDYYETKFGQGVFSANKIKELVAERHNFNSILDYSYNSELVGYAICYDNEKIRHYAYPFYDLDKFANNFGMGMMLLAILDAQEQQKDYIYLGSATRPADIYKLQFTGLEWFDGKLWQADIDPLKTLLNDLA